MTLVMEHAEMDKSNPEPLNLDEQDALGAEPDVVFEGYENLPSFSWRVGLCPEEIASIFRCSERVGRILQPDVMKSVAHLLPDILQSLPVLLYQGKSFLWGVAAFHFLSGSCTIFEIAELLLPKSWSPSLRVFGKCLAHHLPHIDSKPLLTN